MVTHSSLMGQSQPVQTDEIAPSGTDLNGCTLRDVVHQLSIDNQTDIPLIIWLFENPDSPIALPGKIDLYGHDCIHALLNRMEHTATDEAFVLGFTMGNDDQIHWLHQLLFKLISSSLYPKKYRFSWKDFQSFDAGFVYGRSIQLKNLNQIDFRVYQNSTVAQVKQLLGLVV